MPQADILMAVGHQKERFHPLPVLSSPEMSLTGQSLTVSTLVNQLFARTCSKSDCQGLGHGSTSGALSEVLVPDSGAIDREQKNVLLHCVYSSSFIHFAEMN